MEQKHYFTITITHEKKEYTLLVRRTETGDSFESYEVTANSRRFVFRCNWPVLRRRNLKHRLPTWQLIEGVIPYRNFYELITKAIEQYVKNNPL